MRRLIFSLLVLASLLCACGAPPSPAPQKLTVFAAASLTDAFKEIAEAFLEAHSGANLSLNFAGSQTLRSQIEQGAQADVFASANAREMNTLVSGGYVDTAEPRVFLTNKLVVILPPANPASIRSLEDLSKPGLKLILAAEDVPVGNYARQSLDLMDAKFGVGFKDKVLANVVSNEEDVKHVVAKVQLGEADAGIVYTSDAVAAPELKSVEIPTELNVIAKYPIAALSKSQNAALAAEFVTYVLSAKGQAVLQKWGFSPAE